MYKQSWLVSRTNLVTKFMMLSVFLLHFLFFLFQPLFSDCQAVPWFHGSPPVFFNMAHLTPYHCVLHFFAMFDENSTKKLPKNKQTKSKPGAILSAVVAVPPFHPSTLPFPTRAFIFSNMTPATAPKDRIYRAHSKHIDQFHILLLSSNYPKSSLFRSAFYTFYTFGMVSTSLIFILNQCAKCAFTKIFERIPSSAFQFVAVTLFMPFKFKSNSTILAIHSNHHSTNSTTSPLKHIQLNGNASTPAANPLELHRRLFYRWSTLNPIITLTHDEFQYLSNKVKVVDCAKTRVVTSTMFCTYDINAAIQIGMQHNMSLQIVDRDKAISTTVGGRGSLLKSLYIDTLCTRSDHDISSNHQFRAFHFNKFKVTTISYCVVDKKSESKFNQNVHTRYLFNFTPWTQGFTKRLWVAVAVLLVSCAFLLTATERFEMATVLKNMCVVGCLLIREGTITNRLYLLVSLSTMLLSMVYENVMVSNLAITFPPSKFETLGQLLDSGYKIVWNDQTTNDMSPAGKPHFQIYFQRNGQSYRLNTSFERLGSKAPGRQSFIAQMWVRYQRKFATYHDAGIKADCFVGKYKGLFQKYYDKYYRNDGPPVYCYVLKEPLSPRISYWEVVTLNRYWVLETIGWINDSGLRSAWEEWSNSDYVSKEGMRNRTVKGNKLQVSPEYIGMMHLWGLMALCGGAQIILGLAGLVMELLRAYWDHAARVSEIWLIRLPFEYLP